MVTGAHYISIIITLILVSAAGIYTTRFVRSSNDFTVGGKKIGALLVSGSLIGGFVGGTSIIGTTQMAFEYGFCGIWFTLGAGLSCFFMAGFLVKPLREKDVETIPQYLATVYGQNVAPWVAAYTSAGMFIQIGAQVLAAVPVITLIFGIEPPNAAFIATGLIVIYVISGGFWAASLVGFIKLILLYASMLIAGITGFIYLGGFSGMESSLPGAHLTFFPRGVGKELASIFSVIIGFASTQAYLQPLFAASGVKSACRGYILSGILIPVMGAAGIVIGMYMRAAHPGINAAFALPRFLFEYLPAWLGGVAAAVLLVSLIVTGAALTLGVSTLLLRDVFSRLRQKAGDREKLLVSRLLALFIGAAVFGVVNSNVNSLILEWAFLSMALRGVTVFAPLLAGVFLAGKVSPFWGRIAVALSPLITIIWAFAVPYNIDPLYIGLALSVILLTAGIFKQSRKAELPGDRESKSY